MMRIILIVFLILNAIPAFAQAKEIPKEVVDLANNVMLEIYHDIDSLKSRYKELKNFGEGSFLVNKYGIYMINYSYAEVDETLGEIPYAFGLTVVPMEDVIFSSAKRYAFDMGFPLLDLKFSGYKIINFKSKQYDINTSIQKFGNKLWDFQQKFIPLQLSLKSSKENFNVGENIEFTVSLANNSNQNWIIKDLGRSSLYCIYDNRAWGAYEAGSSSGDQEIVIKAHQTITKLFRGGSFPLPRELDIHCTYNLPFKDIKPTSSLKLHVLDK